MSYQQKLTDEIVRGLKKKPSKSSKMKHLVKLDKYLERTKTGK